MTICANNTITPMYDNTNYLEHLEALLSKSHYACERRVTDTFRLAVHSSALNKQTFYPLSDNIPFSLRRIHGVTYTMEAPRLNCSDCIEMHCEMRIKCENACNIHVVIQSLRSYILVQ